MEVVFRPERRASGGDEIEHRDVLADVEPVGSGDRHARRPQRPDHRLERRAALAHQHQDVAGHRYPPAFVAGPGPGSDRLGDTACQHDRRGAAFGLVDGQGPGVGLVVLLGRLGRPQLDEARRLRTRALMDGADRSVVEGEATEMTLDPEGFRQRR